MNLLLKNSFYIIIFLFMPEDTQSIGLAEDIGETCESCDTCTAQSMGLAEAKVVESTPTQALPRLTYGQEVVGLTFNPGNNPEVDRIKKLYAEIIDDLNRARNAKSWEVVRLLSIAITEAQTAQMWAVKAVTWKS